MALQRDSLVVPVKLLISVEENNKRIQRPDRVLCYKSLSIEGNAELINITHSHLLEIDVSDLTASALAEKLLEHTNNIESMNNILDYKSYYGLIENLKLEIKQIRIRAHLSVNKELIKLY